MASNGKITVTTSSQLLIAAQTGRSQIRLYNNSTSYPVWRAVGEAAVVGEGAPIGRVSADDVPDFDIIEGKEAELAHFFIADGGSASVSYITV